MAATKQARARRKTDARRASAATRSGDRAPRRRPRPHARASRARNSLSEAMLAALQAAIDGAARRRGVRAVVIAAKGTAFCAGHDLKELTAHRSDADGGARVLSSCSCASARHDALDRALPEAGDRGRAGHGAGGRLPAGRHVRSGGCGRGGAFCTPGVNIGLFCSTPMVALSRNVPRKRAMEMLLLGEHAAGARRPPSTASSIASCRPTADGRGAGARPSASPPSSRRRSPSARRRSTARSRCRSPTPMTTPPRVMVENMMHAEAEEGIGAFIDKRTARLGQGAELQHGASR